MFKSHAFEAFYSTFYEFNERLFEHVANLLEENPNQILDLACGNGISTRAIAGTFPSSRVIGADISTELISAATETFVPSNVEYKQASTTDLIRENLVSDLVVIKSAYHLLEASGLSLANFLELLNPDGTLCILEKTPVCIESYDLFAEATQLWKSTVAAERRNDMVIAAHRDERLRVQTARFGKSILMPKSSYRKGIQEKQISCLWNFADDLVERFLDEKLYASKDPLIFEDYDIILLQK